MTPNNLSSNIQKVHLNTLSEGSPGMTAALGQSYAEAAAVCLEHQGHQGDIPMEVFGDLSQNFVVSWDKVTDQMRRAHADLQDATEFGACGFAALLLPELTNLTIVTRSKKGTGFDYWLGVDNGDTLFQDKTRLEVSGILEGSVANINSRVNQKLKQTNCSDGKFPAIIFVSEFGKPCSKVAKK